MNPEAACASSKSCPIVELVEALAMLRAATESQQRHGPREDGSTQRISRTCACIATKHLWSISKLDMALRDRVRKIRHAVAGARPFAADLACSGDTKNRRKPRIAALCHCESSASPFDKDNNDADSAPLRIS